MNCSPRVTTGGGALPYYASQRISLEAVKREKDKSGDSVGHEATAKVVKNKIAPPFRSAILRFRYGIGVDRRHETLMLGIEHHLIDRSGAWYTFPDFGERLQGEANVLTFFEENPDKYNELREKCIRLALHRDDDDQLGSDSLDADLNEPVTDGDVDE